MASATFIITGAVNVSVTITEADGSLVFTVEVLDDTGSIGDLNALFFDLANDSLTSGLTATGDDVTGVNFKADQVIKIDSYTNMNGEVIADLGKFDAGIQFGTAGIGTDDIRQTQFTLSHVSQPLTLADLSLQDFGARLTSVGAEDGARTESLKLGTTAPDLVSQPPATGDDLFTLTEQNGDNPPGEPETDADGFVFNVLDNDGPDGAPYNGTVTTVGGQPNIEYYVDGSDGGSFIIYADGTFDFSVYDSTGHDDFVELNDGDVAQTSITYGTDDGTEHVLTIAVTGIGTDGTGIANA